MKQPLLVVHRYLGLLLAGFLFIAGITGSFLAFYAEFDALFNPGLYRIESTGQAPASPGQLLDAVAAFDPRIQVYYLPIVEQPRRASVVYVEPRIDPATQQAFAVPFDEVFIDPLTAKVRGARMWGECCGSDSIIPIMHKLHNRLFLPTAIGRPLWGIIALLWSVMAVIGLLLTWPQARPRFALWLRSWRPQGRLPLLPQSINLHKAAGLWFWIIILAVTSSGVALGLERQVFMPVVQWISGEAAQPQISAQPAPLADGHSHPVDALLARAAAFARSQGIAETPSGIWIDHASASWEIEFGAKDAAGWGQGSITLLADNGDITANALSGQRDLQSAAKAIRDRVHSGRVLGLPGRILVFLCGWAVALLSLTGVIIWFKRRAQRRLAA